MSGRRWPGRDRGSFTAEFAAGLPALMVLLLLGLAAVSAAVLKAECVDAARDTALAAARGDEAGTGLGPEGAEIETTGDGDAVTARVRVRLRLPGTRLSLITVEGRATAPREPDTVGGLP